MSLDAPGRVALMLETRRHRVGKATMTDGQTSTNGRDHHFGQDAFVPSGKKR
jgi:hypothetical protein